MGKKFDQNFYPILNAGLRDKNYKIFLPFIKMMYEGIKRKVFKTVKNEKLYSGGIISNKELQKIKLHFLDDILKILQYLHLK